MESIEIEQEKNYPLSYEKQIEKMNLVFSNAKNIFIDNFKDTSYTEARLDILLSGIENLRVLDRTQKEKYTQYYNHVSQFEHKRKELNEQYQEHLAICQYIMQKNTNYVDTLELSGERRTTYKGWCIQLTNFYTKLLESNELLLKIGLATISKKDLLNTQTKLLKLIESKELLNKERLETQQTTEIRDKAFDKLLSEYTEFVQLAKKQIQDPEDLQTLGIATKR